MSSHPRLRVAAYLALAGVLFLALAGHEHHTTAQLRANQVRGCERGNQIRVTLQAFAGEAVRTREAQAAEARRDGDRDLAALNFRAAARYREIVARSAPIDCEARTR